MINRLRIVMDKAHSIQNNGLCKNKTEILRKKQKEMLRVKKKENIVTEMKNIFDGLSRLDATTERISELENISAKISKTEK